MKTDMQKLVDYRNGIDREIADLMAKREGISQAIRLIQGVEPKVNGRKEGIKDMIFVLLEENPTGLDADGIVSKAAEKGKRKIKKTTASSMLSRMKAEKQLTFDGHVYRLPQTESVNGVHH